MVVTSSLGYMIDPLLMRAARRKNICTASVIHSWDNTSTKDYRGALPDKVVTWNSIMAKEVEIFHDIDKSNIFVGGIAHWDSFFRKSDSEEVKRENPFLEIGCSEDRPIIYYGTSSYKIFPGTIDVITKLIEAIETGRIWGHPQLVVRLHPSYLYSAAREKLNQIRSTYRELRQRYPGSLYLDLPQMPQINGGLDMPLKDLKRHASMLRQSDVLLTEYSTLMIEAAIFDNPAMNIGFGRYRNTNKSISYLETFAHIQRILKTQASRNAYSFDDLCKMLSLYLQTPLKIGNTGQF